MTLYASEEPDRITLLKRKGKDELPADLLFHADVNTAAGGHKAFARQYQAL